MFKLVNFNRVIVMSCALVITITSLSSGSAHASDAGAFIGGMVTTKVLSNMSRRTRAEEVQAYNSSRAAQPAQATQQAPAPTSKSQSTEEKLAQLDKLAAGGYITKEEYKAKRKSIIDSM